jgi:hypothetical protein
MQYLILVTLFSLCESGDENPYGTEATPFSTLHVIKSQEYPFINSI